jgi:hypothetical protein
MANVNLTGTRPANTLRIVDVLTSYAMGPVNAAMRIRNNDGSTIERRPQDKISDPFSTGVVVFGKRNATIEVLASMGFIKRDFKRYQRELGMTHMTASFTVERSTDGIAIVTRVYNVKAWQDDTLLENLYPEF